MTQDYVAFFKNIYQAGNRSKKEAIQRFDDRYNRPYEVLKKKKKPKKPKVAVVRREKIREWAFDDNIPYHMKDELLLNEAKKNYKFVKRIGHKKRK